MKRGRRNLLIAVGCVFAVVIVWLAWPGEREPEYQGRKLSEWVKLCDYGERDPPSPHYREVSEAVRNIGTNAFPCILRWSRSDGGKLSVIIGTTVGKLPAGIGRGIAGSRYFQGRWGADQFRPPPAALFCFEALGGAAKPVVPDLVRMNDPKEDFTSRQVAMRALSLIGRDAIPALLSVAGEPRRDDRTFAIMCLGDMGGTSVEGSGAVPALVQCLKDQNVGVTLGAAVALGRLGAEPDIAVPALAACLRDPRRSVAVSAAEALGQIGPRASAAVPALREAMNDPEPARRLHSVAANALHAITLEAPGTSGEGAGNAK